MMVVDTRINQAICLDSKGQGSILSHVSIRELVAIDTPNFPLELVPGEVSDIRVHLPQNSHGMSLPVRPQGRTCEVVSANHR